MKRRTRNKWILAIVGGIAGVLVLLTVVGAVFGKKTNSSASQSITASAPTLVPAPSTVVPTAESQAVAPEAAVTTSATNSAPTTAPQLGAVPSDPRCAPASASVVTAVAAGLSKAGYELRNGTVITAGGLVYFGGSIFDGAGKMKERSDVWVVKNGAVYASTGGARNNTMFPKASAAPLNISPGDEIVQALDRCVINQTLGR
ncbi:DUF2510 domain-containing protein [Nocardia sp. NPDC058058]|uniref:DUF2510 domain-containing protein n=1 Tax=Nocardia sp. NPDC058058 TaxID=3346317 RepID=UPI0036DF53D9